MSQNMNNQSGGTRNVTESNYQRGDVLISDVQTQKRYTDPSTITFTVDGQDEPLLAYVEAAKLLNFCIAQGWVTETRQKKSA